VENARQVHAEAATDFARQFGRQYGPIDEYRTDDAEFVLVMAGSFATKGKAAVNRARAQGQRVGLVRMRLIRPLPRQELAAALAGRRAVGVIDQNLSPGLGGILFHELAGVLAGAGGKPPILRSFVGGLGGKDISEGEFKHVVAVIQSTGESSSEPELLMTRGEWQHVRSRLAVAGKPMSGTAT
jgi:pyruvate ferredoxin oxidoreductase alpha subunit